MFGNITIFGITFYTTGTSSLAMIIILPIAAIIIYQRTKNRCQNLPQPLDLRTMRRKASKRIGLFALILFIALFWDVVVTGLRVHWLCKKEGGLHVYRTVEAEGFLGSGFKEWLEYGFQHIEEDEFGQKYRLSMENGKIRREKVDSFISRYELVGPERLILSNSLSRERYYVKDRETGEVLGERITFGIYRGWVDRGFPYLTDWEFKGWICGNTIMKDGKITTSYPPDLIKLVLKPNKICKEEGDKK